MRTETIAWVESPLQLLGALEYAELNQGVRLTVIPRGGDAQLEYTAAHVAAVGLLHGFSGVTVALDRRLMPARVFAPDTHWLVGDPFSGQVQLRLDRAEPTTLALVDDGGITRHFARTLHAGEPLVRPRPPRAFAAFRRDLAARTTRRLRQFAADGRLTMTTYLAQDDPAVTLVRDLGVSVVTHRFDVTRRIGLRADAVPIGARIVLGTAAVADGLTDPSAALALLQSIARDGAVAYLPHRREPGWFLAAVERLPQVTVVPARVPIELALAGTQRSLDVMAPVSSTAETLPVVLRDTGSIVRSIGEYRDARQ
jgi:hypothetical protein